MHYNQTIYYFTSAFFHLVLIIVMGLSVDFSPTLTQYGDQRNNNVKSYLYNDNLFPHPDVQKAKMQPLLKNKSQSEVVDKMIKLNQWHHLPRQENKATDSVQNKSNGPAHEMERASGRQGQPIERLLALLHDAIQKQQHYPPSAFEMERQGRVTVKFILFPTGFVRDLRVVKSSGTKSLDDAALSAVKDALPFSQVEHFLTASREFSIDIVFELE